MLTEKDIKEKGYEEVADNLYLKEGNLYVQHKGQLVFAASLTEEEFDNISDLQAYKRLIKKNEEANNPKKKDEKRPPEEKKRATEALAVKADDYMRGTEEKVVRLMDTKLQLDSIIAASADKSKPGEGLLWHELRFGGKQVRIHKEPSVELVDMIAQDMGHITTIIKDFGTNILEDPNTHKKYLTYYCVVEATDGITKTSGLGAAEQIIDFDEINNNSRTFARTNAIRKAERNAKERMIPIPRRALVELVIRKLEDHQKAKK